MALLLTENFFLLIYHLIECDSRDTEDLASPGELCFLASFHAYATFDETVSLSDAAIVSKVLLEEAAKTVNVENEGIAGFEIYEFGEMVYDEKDGDWEVLAEEESHEVGKSSGGFSVLQYSFIVIGSVLGLVVVVVGIVLASTRGSRHERSGDSEDIDHIYLFSGQTAIWKDQGDDAFSSLPVIIDHRKDCVVEVVQKITQTC